MECKLFNLTALLAASAFRQPLSFIVCMPTLATKGNACMCTGIMIFEMNFPSIWFILFLQCCMWMTELVQCRFECKTIIRRLVTFYENKTLKKLEWKEVRRVICPSPVAVNKCAWNTLQDFSTRRCFFLSMCCVMESFCEGSLHQFRRPGPHGNQTVSFFFFYNIMIVKFSYSRNNFQHELRYVFGSCNCNCNLTIWFHFFNLTST